MKEMAIKLIPKKANLVLTLVLFAVLIFSYVLSAPWVLFLVSFLLLFFSLTLPATLNSLLVSRLIYCAFIMAAVLQLESLVFWGLHLEVNSFHYASVTYLATSMLAIILASKRGIHLFDFSLFLPTRIDFLLLLPAALLTSALWARVILPSEANDISIVRSVTYGMDDATHIGLFGDLLRTEGDLLIRSEEKSEMSNGAHSSYPRGWHAATAVIATSFLSPATANHQVTIYFYVKLMSLFALVVALALFVHIVLRRLKYSMGSAIQQGLFVIIVLGNAIILILPLYFEGFFSFLPVLAYLLLFTILKIEDASRRNDSTRTALLTLFVVASTLTWMLTGPLLLAALAIDRWVAHKAVKKIPVFDIVLMSVAFAVCAAQAYILFSANHEVIGELANPGGITHPTPYLLAVCLVIFILTLKKNSQAEPVARRLLEIIAPALFMLVSILLYVSIKTQEITYYYYKFESIILILLVPIVCVLLLKYIYDNSNKALPGPFLSAILFISVLGLTIPSLIGHEYFSNTMSRTKSYALSSADSAEIIAQSLDREFSRDNTRVIYFYPDQPGRSILSSNIARISYISEDCDHAVFRSAYTGDIEMLAKNIQTCGPDIPLVVVNTSIEYADELRKRIPEEVLTKEVRLETSN